MKTLDFVAVALKNTHHVLGVLSRDADPAGGSDLALLAPEALTVRENRSFDSQVVSATPAAELQMPAAQLEAVVVKGPKSALRRQVFADPLNCVISDDGSVAPVAAGGNIPKLTLIPRGSVVEAVKVDITSNAVADTAFTVILQEADPPQDKPPFVCITEGKITAGQPAADNVLITLMPGKTPTLNPIPKARPVYVLVAVAGHVLTIGRDPNP